MGKMKSGRSVSKLKEGAEEGEGGRGSLDQNPRRVFWRSFWEEMGLIVKVAEGGRGKKKRRV